MQTTKEKEKLKRDIEKLKSLHTGIKKRFDFFENEKHLINNRESISDYDEWKCYLYKYFNFVCTNISNEEYIFEFNSLKKNSNEERYFVQLLREEHKFKLGCWRMPILLDVKEIFANRQIENFNELNNFLLECKHYLDCQKNRQNQFDDLKAYMKKLRSCSVQANLEIYTFNELQMFHLKDLETEKIFNISLYIIYELNEILPSRFIIESIYEETVPRDIKQKLIHFFKKFKNMELNLAFETTVNEINGQYFQWDGNIENYEDIEMEESVQREERENVQSQENVQNEEEIQNEENVQNEVSNEENIQSQNDVNNEKNTQGEENEFNDVNNNDNIKRKPQQKNNSEKQMSITKMRKNQQTKLNKSTVKENVRKGKQNELEGENKMNKQNKNKLSQKNKNKEGKKIEKEEGQTVPTEIMDLQNNEASEQKNDETIQKVKKNPRTKTLKSIKEKTEIKGKKTVKKSKISNKPKKMFDLANFALKAKSESQVENFSSPIGGSSQHNLESDREVSEVSEFNNQDLNSLPIQSRKHYSSDSELDEVLEEPNQNLIKELEKIQENSSVQTRKRRNFKNKKGDKKLKN